MLPTLAAGKRAYAAQDDTRGPVSYLGQSRSVSKPAAHVAAMKTFRQLNVNCRVTLLNHDGQTRMTHETPFHFEYMNMRETNNHVLLHGTNGKNEPEG